MFNDSPEDDFLSNFSLAGVKAASGGRVLPPGQFVCTIRSIKLEKTKANNGSKMLVVSLVADSGDGSITAYLNIHNTTSAEATRIGREQCRALAEGAGVPDPDAPFASGVDAMNGMRVGVIVGTEKYEGKDRSRVAGFCKPADVKGEQPAAAAAGKIGDDDVPF